MSYATTSHPGNLIMTEGQALANTKGGVRIEPIKVFFRCA